MEPDEGVELEVRIGAVTHKGRYTADRHGVITVWHPAFGEKISQRGGVNTLSIARTMLKRLILDGTKPRAE